MTVSSEEVERGKPAPDVYLEALGRLGAAPDAATAVEDSDNGIRGRPCGGDARGGAPEPAYPPATGARA